MRRHYHCLAAGVAVALLLGPAAIADAQAAEPATLTVIVDGSGSMWGTIEGSRQNKLVLVREALRRGLAGIAPQTRVGLAAFGHRRGDCGDVEVMRTPDAVDVDRLMLPLSQMSPRGRGPLTLALREAAKSLPREAGPRSLLLVHDDADNCQPDVCAAAAELRAANIAVHVVGLNVKADDMARMACLPQATGGRQFNALNAEQAASLIEEALRLAAGDPGWTEPRPAAPLAAGVVAPAPIPATGPPALHLRALLAPNTEPLAMPLHWIVAPEARPDAVLFDARATNPVVQVAPGRYVVEAHEGPVSARQAVELRDDRPAAVNLVFNAGFVRVRALGQKSGAPFADAIISVSNADSRAGAPVAVFRAGEAMAVLPAGRFLVRAELGLVRGEKALEVQAGRQVLVDIPLNGARLQLATASRDGTAPFDAPVFSVVEDDPDAPRGKRELARSAARQVEFMLPPGTYYIIARQGSVEARERLAIGPGEVVRRTLSAPPAGRLSLSTKTTGGASPTSGELISYTIERIDGTAQEAVSTSHAAPTLLLPSGRYRVEGRSGLMNVRTVREVEVKAGLTQQLVLEHQTASLKLRFAGAAPSDVFWDIRDESGRAVWTSGLAEPLATLQAGRYLVRAEAREKRYERSVELRIGDARLVEISPD